MQDIAAEFGGDAPHALSEYYGAATGVPASGQISLQDFYGASAGISETYICTGRAEPDGKLIATPRVGWEPIFNITPSSAISPKDTYQGHRITYAYIEEPFNPPTTGGRFFINLPAVVPQDTIKTIHIAELGVTLDTGDQFFANSDNLYIGGFNSGYYNDDPQQPFSTWFWIDTRARDSNIFVIDGLSSITITITGAPL